MRFLSITLGLAASGSALSQKLPWMPSDPGKIFVAQKSGGLSFGDRAISATYGHDGSILIASPWSSRSLSIATPLQLEFADSTKLPSSQLQFQAGSAAVDSSGRLRWTRTALVPTENLKCVWTITMNPGSHYLREAVSLEATKGPARLTRIELGKGIAGHVETGTVQGSPITAGNFFVGLEHPMAHSLVMPDGKWSVSIDRKIPISAGQKVEYSAVIGVAPTGQMRRSFLAYLEKERPRPYQPFLHYNSWYDLGYFNRYTADQCVDRIKTFGDELAAKRGVKLSSFLFDDGWDDPKTVWKFHQGFPDGFTPLTQAAASFGAGPGVWLSPWGGYAGPRAERLAAGKAAGYEIDTEGYALSGPKYYDLFHQVCLDFVTKYGINQFKFDGTGSPDKQYPGSKFSSDFEAAIDLIHDLRVAKPGLFINLTTGTWPSPFWTKFADSIWRGGNDHSFDGVGPWREKWITYRDGDTYHNIVKAKSMYPLNSLMLHGLIYAQYAQHLGDDPSGAFRHEVRSYFGNGTQLQEMYITPKLLTSANWDDLATSAKWSLSNKDTLVDTHWVGGDPSGLSVYGWASWSPHNAILTLRNPSDKPQAFSIEINRIFELPSSVRGVWRARSPYADTPADLRMPVGSSKVVVLQPFEVRVMEGPVR